MRSHILAVISLVGILSVTPVVAQQVREVRETAPSDRAADFPAQVLAHEIARIEAEDIYLVRLLEGGTHNTNIRHDENITPDTAVYRAHPRTVDVWIVQRGSGTLGTGGRMVNDELVDGVERVIGEGDLVFIPAGTLHGIKETISITWLNIRYDMAE